MTVAQLIAELQKLDPELPVYRADYEASDSVRVEGVEVEQDRDENFVMLELLRVVIS